MDLYSQDTYLFVNDNILIEKWTKQERSDWLTPMATLYKVVKEEKPGWTSFVWPSLFKEVKKEEKQNFKGIRCLLLLHFIYSMSQRASLKLAIQALDELWTED